MDTAKRGDILKKEVLPGQIEYFHVENVHPDGSVDAIADSTGKPAGLHLKRDTLVAATMGEVLEARQRRAVPYLQFNVVNAVLQAPDETQQ